MITNRWDNPINYELIDFFQVKVTTNLILDDILFEVLYDKDKFALRANFLYGINCEKIINKIPYQFYIKYLHDNYSTLNSILKMINFDPYETNTIITCNINDVYNYFNKVKNVNNNFFGHELEGCSIHVDECHPLYHIHDKLISDINSRGKNAVIITDKFKISFLKLKDIESNKVTYDFLMKDIPQEYIYRSLAQRYNKNIEDINIIMCHIVKFNLTICLIPHPSNILCFCPSDIAYYMFLPLNILSLTDYINDYIA